MCLSSALAKFKILQKKGNKRKWREDLCLCSFIKFYSPTNNDQWVQVVIRRMKFREYLSEIAVNLTYTHHTSFTLLTGK